MERPETCFECIKFIPSQEEDPSCRGYCRYLNYRTNGDSEPCSAGWKDRSPGLLI